MRVRVAAARVARLATVGAAGAPHLVPFCFVLEGDTIFSAVDRKPKATDRLRRLANVAREPRVAVLVDHYEEDWRQLWWVRLDGRAEVLATAPDRDLALGLLAAKYDQYQREPPEGAVLAIAVERWRGWAAV